MKRALLILLMMLLPLHMAWAAVAGIYDLADTSLLEAASENAGLRSAVDKSAQNIANKYERGCCPGCHVFCNLAAATPAYSFNSSVPLEQCFVAGLSDATAYQSHIPDGPIRPKWPAAS